MVSIFTVGVTLSLTVQVCLQKEQESRVAMELQVTEMEERLDQVTSELSRAQQERERLAEELEREKSHSKVSD